MSNCSFFSTKYLIAYIVLYNLFTMKKNDLNIEIKEKFLEMEVQGMEEKSVTYVFAKNGVGKTTYANHLPENENLLIFNKKFIMNNIFIEKLDKDKNKKNKPNTENKVNTFKILFGKGIKNLVDKEEKNNDKRNKNKDDFKRILDAGFNMDCNNIFSTGNVKMNEYLKQDFDFSLLSKEEIKRELEDKIVIKGNINRINIAIKNILDINSLIDEFNKSSDALKGEINKIPREKLKIIKLHKDALEIGENFRFIDYDVDQSKLSNYLEEINNSKAQLTNQYNKMLKQVKDKIKLLVEDEMNKSFNIQELKDALELLEKLHNENYEFFEASETDESKLIKIEDRVKLEEFDEEKVSKEIEDFFNLNKHRLLKESIEPLISKRKELDKELKEIRALKEEKVKDITKSTVDRFNYFIEMFGLEGFNLTIKKRESIEEGATCELQTENSTYEIESLSEGETNILALSYFFVILENKVNTSSEDLIVIIDDPFNSNDHTRIHKFKEVKFKYENKTFSLSNLLNEYEKNTKTDCKLIILTHSLDVIFSLTSNLVMRESNDIETMFNKTKFEESIEIIEWVKIGIEVKAHKINSSSFFPNEEVIIKKMISLNKEVVNNLEPTEAKTLWYILMRLNDIRDPNARNLFKLLVQNPQWGKNDEGDKYKVIDEAKMINTYKLLIENFSGLDDFDKWVRNNESSIIKFFEKYNLCIKEKELLSEISDTNIEKITNDSIEKEIIKKWVKRTVDIINKAIVNNDDNLFRRLRHRDYLSSTIVAFGLNEF